jgi:hypothetical protein
VEPPLIEPLIEPAKEPIVEPRIALEAPTPQTAASETPVPPPTMIVVVEPRERVVEVPVESPEPEIARHLERKEGTERESLRATVAPLGITGDRTPPLTPTPSPTDVAAILVEPASLVVVTPPPPLPSEHPEETSIEVHIGRVEVNPPPATAQPPAPQRPAPPEYPSGFAGYERARNYRDREWY